MDRPHRNGRPDPSRLGAGVALALLAFWLPLPFGSVVPWSVAGLELVAFLLLLAAVLLARGARSFAPAAFPGGALIFVALLGVVQAVRWPAGFVRMISPTHAALADQAAGAGAAVSAAAVPLSLAPPVSVAVALRFAAMAALLLAAVWVFHRRTPRRIVAVALVAAGLFQVVYGGARWMSGTTTIWEVQVPGSAARLRGTFVNPDHLAVYLELVLAATFAWGWWAARRIREEQSPERRVALVAPPVVIWLALFAGLAFTGSRAGLIAALTGVVVQGALAAVSERRARVGAAGVLVAAVGIGVVAAIGVQEAFGRWLATSRYELSWSDRLEVYAETFELWQRFPWLGSGLGTFKEAFPLVQPTELTGLYAHTHDDYLELLATTGVVGSAVVLAGCLVALAGLTRRLRPGLRSEDRAAALAALGAVAALAVHSVFDFGLSIPAVSATFIVIVGLGLSVNEPGSKIRE